VTAALAPEPMRAVADLLRCIRSRDYAGASVLLPKPAVAEGLDALAAGRLRDGAEQAWDALVATWRAERQADAEAALRPLLDELIAAVADGCGKPPETEPAARLAADIRPVTSREAQQNRTLLAGALVRGRRNAA
jgi:hypothetical protein